MHPLVPRAVAAGRQAARNASSLQAPLLQRASLLSITQIASVSYQSKISYKLKPLEQPANPNSKKKIADRTRAIKRPFVPPPTKTEQELAASLPYIVQRTPYAQVPIYRKYMSGGNRVLILIKRVNGDRKQLVDDLAKALKLEKEDIRLNPTTQHIEIKVRPGPLYSRATSQS